jgi:hypothetical protein
MSNTHKNVTSSILSLSFSYLEPNIELRIQFMAFSCKNTQWAEFIRRNGTIGLYMRGMAHILVPNVFELKGNVWFILIYYAHIL